MKRVVLSFLFLSFLSTAFIKASDPVIMKIAGKDIKKSEFEYIWNKNNTNNAVDKKSLEDYLDLFVNFKLKVAEAKFQGIDTTKSFINELNGYRNQLTAPYLTDKEAEDKLISQTYDRIKEYVEASHILIKVDPDASPEDTLIAWEKINKIYAKAISKGSDFSKLAKEFSEDASKDEGGYLGYATGFRYVYTFENVMYTTPVGKVSKPFRSQFGYHIVKVTDRRPAGGKYRSGHIMKMVPQGADELTKQDAKDSIFKIYERILKGEDFKTFAVNNSDDRNAASNNGEYGFMFCGSLPIEYEDAVYKLKPGEVSPPFSSKYGWHIVKALEFMPYPTKEEMMEDLKGIMGRDERSLIPKSSLVEKLKKEYLFTEFKQNYLPFEDAWNSLRTKKDSTSVKSLLTSSSILFRIGEQNCTQKDFAQYLKLRGYGTNNIRSCYNDFVQEQIMKYEDNMLESKYPDFGHLMQEYSDGILLFEVSNREVWDKATKDTAGLEKYFTEHKVDYNWEKPHYKGFAISCADKKTAAKAKKLIKGISSDSVSVVLKRTLNNDSTTLIKIERGLFTAGENSVVDSLVFKQKNTKQDAKFPVCFVNGKMLKTGPESYSDVRGLVISDYQNYLEKIWIEALRKKFEVKIYNDVVNTVNKD